MSKIQFVNTDMVKQLNRSLILKEIRKHGPLTKIELARKFDLTFPAVGNIIGELVKAGLIAEAGYGASNGGRPPVLYEMKWDSVYIVAVSIGVNEISAAVMDLRAEKIGEVEINTKSAPLIDRVYQVVDQVLDVNKHIDVAGIGVSAPGPIDAANGKILAPPNLTGVNDIHIQHHLENRYHLPAVLQKDANASALAEQWFGHVNTNESILYIFNDQGLGGGLIINSRIHPGFGNGAGEIGHMSIDIDGPKCSCGNFGCLEVMSSGLAIQRRVKEEIRRGHPTTLADYYKADLDEITLERVVEHAGKGDRLALHILEESGRYLGLGVANAINLFSPDQVIFGGSVTALYPESIEISERVAKSRTLSPLSQQIPFSISNFDHHSYLIGAAAAIQQHVFDHPEAMLF